MKSHSLAALVALIIVLTGCNATRAINAMGTMPQVATLTKTEKMLRALPPAKRRVPVTVYDFLDQTGQHKPNDNMAEYSRAVTQGGLAILINSLLEAGDHSWFKVIERQGLNNLLQERKIVRMMREQFAGPGGQKLQPLGPLLYAGIMLEGGIVSYDSNTITGGAGARYLGIGGSTEYRRDIVTVYLRAVSVKNGEVLVSVDTTKTIFSSALRGDAFKFVAFDEILEIESGITINEPPQFAVRQAIEMGVYSMIMEGALKGLWSFDDPAAGQRALAEYQELKDTSMTDGQLAGYEPAPKRTTPNPSKQNSNDWNVEDDGTRSGKLPQDIEPSSSRPSFEKQMQQRSMPDVEAVKTLQQDSRNADFNQIFNNYYQSIISPIQP